MGRRRGSQFSNEPAAIYNRISLDRDLDADGVRRQEHECRQKAASLGLNVVRVFQDNDTSAYSGKRRPAFEDLLTAAEAGEFRHIVVWATDRLVRRPIELERVMSVLEPANVLVHPVIEGELDLSSADGRFRARLMGNVAAFESERKAERMRARARQRAREGWVPTVRRPFGWQWADNEAQKGALVPHPDEAPVVRELYQRFLDGETLKGLARWLTAEGWTGTTGGEWKQSHVSRLLRSPRNGGIVYEKQEDGTVVTYPNRDGSLVDESVFWAAQKILTDPSRRKKPGRPSVSWLSGSLTCYKCGGRVRPSSNHSRAGVRYKTYSCDSQHVSWKRDELESAIEGQILAFLEDHKEQLLDSAASQTAGDPRLTELDALRARRDAMSRMFAAGQITEETLVAGTAPLSQSISRLEDELKSSRAANTADLLDGPDIAASWHAAPIPLRTRVVKALIEQITVGSRRSGELGIKWRADEG